MAQCLDGLDKARRSAQPNQCAIFKSDDVVRAIVTANADNDSESAKQHGKHQSTLSILAHGHGGPEKRKAKSNLAANCNLLEFISRIDGLQCAIAETVMKCSTRWRRCEL